MARDFTKNVANVALFGVNQIEPLLSGAPAVTISVLAYARSFDTTSASNNQIFNSLLNAQTTGANLACDALLGGTSAKIHGNGRSVSTDGRQGRSGTTSIPLNTWVHLGSVIDYNNDRIQPVYNGLIENSGTVTFANTTYTLGTPTGNTGIGNGNPGDSTAEHFDGLLAELAVWNVALSADELKGLGAGFIPPRVRRSNLVCYWPMREKVATDAIVDVIGGINATVTGSIPAARHPRTIGGLWR